MKKSKFKAKGELGFYKERTRTIKDRHNSGREWGKVSQKEKATRMRTGQEVEDVCKNNGKSWK